MKLADLSHFDVMAANFDPSPAYGSLEPSRVNLVEKGDCSVHSSQP